PPRCGYDWADWGGGDRPRGRGRHIDDCHDSGYTKMFRVDFSEVSSMRCKRITIPAMVAVALLAAAAVVAQTTPPGSGWTTGMQFQNVGQSDAEVRLYLYTPQGQSIDCGTRTAVPGGSVNYLVDTHC